MIRLTPLSPQVQVVEPDRHIATQQFAGIWGDICRAIEALETPIPDIPDLAPAATLADVIATVNALLGELRDKGAME